MLTVPGMASNFPPSCGIHHEWMTSQSGAVDMELDGPALRRSHSVHRDDAVRVPVLPRELRADDLDDEVLLAAGRGGHVLDDRQLDEDEGPDRAQDEHRSDRPGELEAVRAVDLGAVGDRAVGAAAGTARRRAISSPSTSRKIPSAKAEMNQ